MFSNYWEATGTPVSNPLYSCIRVYPWAHRVW